MTYIHKEATNSSLRVALLTAGILIPPTVFYVLLVRSLSGLPFADDYHTILGFLLQWHDEGGVGRFAQIFTFQHNDYRCVFENAIVGLQYQVLGHTNLKVLSMIGNLLVLPICGVLYLLLKACGRPPAYTSLAFVPAVWILFQFQYEGTLNFATSGLQCLPVVLFALLTCTLASRTSRAAFAGTLCSLCLCVASYGNGLFLVPIGAVMYLERKQYRRLAVWCVVSAAACFLYFHRYNFAVKTAGTVVPNNLAAMVQHMSVTYALAFLGSVATVRSPLPAIVFGALVLAVFAYATRDRLYARRPTLYYATLFFIVTGFAVSGLRSTLGLTQALDSRYRINSTVLLILLYFYLADKLHDVRVPKLVLRIATPVLVALLLVFNLGSTYAGNKFLHARRSAIESEMARWERHDVQEPAIPSFLHSHTREEERFHAHLDEGLYAPIEPYLSKGVQAGIYQPPNLNGQHGIPLTARQEDRLQAAQKP